MTRIEKETVLAALSEYAYNHQKAADRCAKNDLETAMNEHRTANIAVGLLEAWQQIINEPCGSVRI